MIFRKKLDPSSASFFEQKYRKTADPWNFEKSQYEQARYDAIIAALAGRRYHKAFEPGCSVGALTAKLLTVCDQVEAIDFAASAIATARQRNPDPRAHFQVMSLPERLPLLGFDLIVLSEIGYYFTAEQWSEYVDSIVSTSAPGSTLIAAHWLGVSQDHRLSGDEVHATLRAHPNLHLQHEERHPAFRLDRLERS
ncbi:nodulation S family protein [Terriglobus aquaticus]|uniref:Nodulation S family protein n=1 Tax=Terriglobus aquaticus TaxID=940139 RepID=A0ABW9KP26_9BACT|nr:nodulation S family protein [Terriglobus aquaticus]